MTVNYHYSRVSARFPARGALRKKKIPEPLAKGQHFSAKKRKKKDLFSGFGVPFMWGPDALPLSSRVKCGTDSYSIASHRIAL